MEVRRVFLYSLLLLALIKLFPTVQTACCPSKGISFKMIDDEDDCSSYNAKSKGKGVCKVRICDDGTTLTGSYCGHGSCNIFGCRCDGGCREGDAIQKFVEFYGDYHIRDVHFT